MSNDVKKIVARVASVAKGAAEAVAVTFGTVLSRNPDGSLNVDDGKGGCTRQMPAANIRVGQKIAIGTEPRIGTTTQLETRYVVVEPLGGCPEDPRTDPTPVTPTEALTTRFGLQQTFDSPHTWDDRDGNYGANSHVVVGFRATAQKRLSAPLWVCRQGHVQFPTTGVIPTGATLYSAVLRFSVSAGTPPTSPEGLDFIVVPSTAPNFGLSDPLSTDLIGHVVRTELGRIPFASIVTGGALNEIELQVDPGDPDIGLTPYFDNTGRTKLAIITEADFTGTPPAASATATDLQIGEITHPRPFLVVSYQPPL